MKFRWSRNMMLAAMTPKWFASRLGCPSVRMHVLPLSGMANVHYAAAASAITLKEFKVVQR